MKYMEKEFQAAIRGQGDIMEVLTESFGDKNLARVCLSYLATAGDERKANAKVWRWLYFTLGVFVTLVFGAIVKVFS
jgi:glutathione S-transferase